MRERFFQANCLKIFFGGIFLDSIFDFLAEIVPWGMIQIFCLDVTSFGFAIIYELVFDAYPLSLVVCLCLSFGSGFWFSRLPLSNFWFSRLPLSNFWFSRLPLFRFWFSRLPLSKFWFRLGSAVYLSPSFGSAVYLCLSFGSDFWFGCPPLSKFWFRLLVQLSAFVRVLVQPSDFGSVLVQPPISYLMLKKQFRFSGTTKASAHRPNQRWANPTG